MKENSVFKERYQILEKIGSGGMSEVYLCKDLLLNTYWAAKYIEKNDDSVVAYHALKKETQRLVKLHHKRIPKIIDCIDTSKEYIVIMELIQGKSLQEIMQEKDIEELPVMKWINEVLDILYYLHHEADPPLLYCDLKPANILLDADDHIILIDFGIALELHQGKANNVSCLGTKGFAPKEQFYPGELDCRSDIYAFGATLYYLFTKQTYQQQAIPHHPLASIMKKCLQEDVDKRYRDISEIQKDMRKLYSAHKHLKLSIIISCFMLLLSWYCVMQIQHLQQQMYLTYLHDEKYIEAIHYMPSKKEAYLYLYDAYKKEKEIKEIAIPYALQQMEQYSLKELSAVDKEDILMIYAFDCLKMKTMEYYRQASMYLRQITKRNVETYLQLCEFIYMHPTLEYMDFQILETLLNQLEKDAEASAYGVYRIQMFALLIDVYYLYAHELGMQVYETIAQLCENAIAYINSHNEVLSYLSDFYEYELLAYYYQANTYQIQLQNELAFTLYEKMVQTAELWKSSGFIPSRNVEEKLQTALTHIQ